MKWPPPKKNQDHQPNMPSQKTYFRANLGLQPETGPNGNFAMFARIWENIVFSVPAQTKFWITLFKLAESKMAQICVLPILTRQPNTHECTPLNKRTLFFRNFEMPTPKMSSKNLQNARHFQQKSKPEIFKLNNFKQIRKCPKHFFGHFHLTPFLPPHPLQHLIL